MPADAAAPPLPVPAAAPAATGAKRQETTRQGIGLARRLRAAALTLALPLALVALWQGVFELGLVRPILLPPPSQVATAFAALTVSGELPRHLAVSLARVLQGFAWGALVGLPLGVGIGLFPRLDRLTDLTLQVLKPIPPIAWIPLAILWFGIGEAGKVYIIFLGAVFPILINTTDGIRQTDRRFVELARVLEIPRLRFIARVVLPGALPAIMTGLRLGLTVAWICVVAAELIAAPSGVGYLIMDARQMFQTDRMLVGMISIGVVGKLMDAALKYLERRLITWKTVYTGH